MESYQPPFDITTKMVSLISEISEKVGRISIHRELQAKPKLRRNNRIRSIHSSLAIEANSLSLNEVKGVIDGKRVLGPQKEIQEVVNAYNAYEEIGNFDPYSVNELIRLHGVMTNLTVVESGCFRKGGEGVFDGERCVFVAPPSNLVPELTEQLFSWMKKNKTEIHPLILSSVFHYEFVFIHPFSDGNGRMARLWQTALISEWNSLFRYMPIESRIYEFQEDYYNAIALCHTQGKSTAFVEFMLEKINETLDVFEARADATENDLSDGVNRLLDVMDFDVKYSSMQLLVLLGLKSKQTLRKTYIDPAMKAGVIGMTEPDKPTSRNQKYFKI